MPHVGSQCQHMTTSVLTVVGASLESPNCKTVAKVHETNTRQLRMPGYTSCLEHFLEGHSNSGAPKSESTTRYEEVLIVTGDFAPFLYVTLEGCHGGLVQRDKTAFATLGLSNIKSIRGEVFEL